MIELEHSRDGLVRLVACGVLTREDYDSVLPRLERIMATDDEVRFLIDLDDFQGWTPEALWRDIQFDVRYRGKIGRVAVVGETRFEEWMTQLTAPFFDAEVRFFPHDERERARAWLEDAACAETETERKQVHG